MLNILSDSDGSILVKFARKTVTEYLENNKKPKLDSEFISKFSEKSGIFVTINNSNALRGCIGFPLPNQQLAEGIVDAAIAAATEDPRFDKVTTSELDDVTFEITILTPPVEIRVNAPDEYFEQIKIGRDGLIVKHDYTSGILLPQVPVEYGWTVKAFLEHVCEKAGLPQNSWTENHTQIFKFEGIIFKEESPNGKVIREVL